MPSDEKPPLIGAHVPIPTYEEAVSSSSRNDAPDRDNESTGLLAGGALSASTDPFSRPPPTRRDGYMPPTVESVRSSIESSFLEEFASPRSSAESLVREMIQMEVDDSGGGGGGSGAGERLRLELTKRISSLSSSLSAISLPRNPFRGVRWPRPRIPELPCFAGINHEALLPIYRILAVLGALTVVYVLLATDIFNFQAVEYAGPYAPENVRRYAEQNIDRGKIRHWLEYVSSFDHMAGTEGDLVLAKYVQGQFSSFGLRTERMEYNVYLNYPKPGGRRVWIDSPRWEAVIDEPRVDKKHENTAVFHGMSKTGEAKGPLVYANYGTRDDFKMLEKEGISVKGAVVLLREGGPTPELGLKVKAAQDRGAVGVLLFTAHEVPPWLGADTSVRRGSVAFTNWLPGDVQTPGYPAILGANRTALANNEWLPQIPSLPLVRLSLTLPV